MPRLGEIFLATALCMLCAVAAAQSNPSDSLEPTALLAAAKAASGGNAWDALRTQHSKVTLSAGGVTGNAERWSDIATGRSYLRYNLPPLSGALGFDGSTPWSQDASGRSRNEGTEVARQLAVNAAYRDRLAFWYPERHPAKFVYKERARRDGGVFDVVGITPEGGREFDLWINADTKLIERMVEQEGGRERTEMYMDLRDVQGVKVPFRVRTNRGDPRYDEVFVVDTLEYNSSLAGVQFARPAPPKADFLFPAGRGFVEIPFEVMNGHLYVRARIDGRGPFRMLFDTGSVNALLPSTANKLVASPGSRGRSSGGGNASSDLRSVQVMRLELADLVLLEQSFAIIDLTDYARRVEGLDDVAGIVGSELYRRFPITLDFERSKAIVHDPATFRYTGNGTPVRFTFKSNIPQVKGSVDGVAGMFDIDTGARTSLVLAAPFATANGLAAKYGAATDVIAGASAGGSSRALLARAGSLSLGEVTVSQPVTLLSTATRGPFADPDLAGSVGYGVLRRFNLTFDYANDVIYFERNANYAQRDVYDRAGMWLERDKAGYRIVDVVNNGAAAHAGLRPGSIVVAVDGKPWRTTSLSALRNRMREAPGTKIRLTLADGSVHIVTLADLV